MTCLLTTSGFDQNGLVILFDDIDEPLDLIELRLKVR